MLYPRFLLCALCVIPAVNGAHQIARDSADALKIRVSIALVSVTVWTFFADYTIVAADGISVNWMVDGTISNAGFFHAADNFFKSREVGAGIPIQLDVADVPCVGVFVVWRLQLNFFIGLYGIVDRNMERICVKFTVCNAGNSPELFTVYGDKASAEPFCRGSEQGEVQTSSFRFSVHQAPQMRDDLKPQSLAFCTFTMMPAGKRLERFSKSDKADAQGSVL